MSAGADKHWWLKMCYIFLWQKAVCALKGWEGYNNECLQEALKDDRSSLKVWGCISVNGVGDLVGITKYGEILIHHAKPSRRRMIVSKCILQENNNPQNTAKNIENFPQRMEEQELWCKKPNIHRKSEVASPRFCKNLPAELLKNCGRTLK